MLQKHQYCALGVKNMCLLKVRNAVELNTSVEEECTTTNVEVNDWLRGSIDSSGVLCCLYLYKKL